MSVEVLRPKSTSTDAEDDGQRSTLLTHKGRKRCGAASREMQRAMMSHSGSGNGVAFCAFPRTERWNSQQGHGVCWQQRNRGAALVPWLKSEFRAGGAQIFFVYFVFSGPIFD